MNIPLPVHTDQVKTLINQITADGDEMRQLWLNICGSDGSPIFPLDLVAFGAVKRNLSTTSGFLLMIDSWNMVCARSLLRIHIDTSLRFSAAWLVDKPHDFATEVIKGERIDKMKDKLGKRLGDAYLVETRSVDYPWLPDVYKTLSGYIHFSGAHIYDSVEKIEKDDQAISFEISDADLKFPEFSWVEILTCFREATSILAKYLDGYAITKSLSPEALKKAKKMHST
jgi:hypothetical protein